MWKGWKKTKRDSPSEGDDGDQPSAGGPTFGLLTVEVNSSAGKWNDTECSTSELRTHITQLFNYITIWKSWLQVQTIVLLRNNKIFMFVCNVSVFYESIGRATSKGVFRMINKIAKHKNVKWINNASFVKHVKWNIIINIIKNW